MAVPDIPVTEGQRLPAIEAILKDRNGPINLTGCTVKFLMARSNVTKIDSAATVVDALEGHVKYSPGASDFSVAGWFDAQWEITVTASGYKQYVPNGRYDTVYVQPVLR